MPSGIALGEPLTVRINSAGGNAIDGLAIFQALRNHDAPVQVRIRRSSRVGEFNRSDGRLPCRDGSDGYVDDS